MRTIRYGGQCPQCEGVLVIETAWKRNKPEGFFADNNILVTGICKKCGILMTYEYGPVSQVKPGLWDKIIHFFRRKI